MSDGFSLFTSLRYDVALRHVSSATATPLAGFNHTTESPLYMLDYHRDRLLRAATHWQWKEAIDALSGDEALAGLAKLAQEFVGPSQPAPLRLRILLDRQGRIGFEKYGTASVSLQNLFPERLPPPGAATTQTPNDPRLVPRWTVVLDHANTQRSEYTHFKTTARGMYDSARQRAAIGLADSREVLLVSQDDASIMEGSLTTPYFWRGGRWVTPPVSRGFSLIDGSGGQDGTSRRWALERGLAVEQVVPADSLTDGEECWISNGVRGFIAAVVCLK